MTQSFGKHLRPRETEKRAREWTDVTECHARLCKRDITERKEAACEVRKALCISLSMQCTHMHTQMHTQRHVHTQHTQTHVCTHTRARTHPTHSSTSPSGAELDSAAGAAWGPPPLRFQAVLTIVSPQTREPGRITAFSESHIVTILYNENGTSQRHRLAGFKRANFRICQNRQEPVGPDCPARPRIPHPAPRTPVSASAGGGGGGCTADEVTEHAALLVWGWAWKDHRAQAQVPQGSGRPDGSTFPDRNHCSPRKVAASEGLSFPQAPSAVPETQSPTPRPVGLPRPRLPEPRQPPLSAARLSARSGP